LAAAFLTVWWWSSVRPRLVLAHRWPPREAFLTAGRHSSCARP